MTSEPSECFVYITLPGTTDSVTVGRLALSQDRRGNVIGRFVYGRSYLSRDDAVEIDPFDLILGPRTYENARLKGIFSALRDAGPDYWGRRIIERRSGKISLSEIDYLLESPEDRAGALGFGLNQKPPAPLKKYNKTLDLKRLQEIALKVLEDPADDDDSEAIQARELLDIGTSMGGARPKAVVEDSTGLWLSKFSRPDDRWNNPRVEHAMLELANACGISAARSRVEKIGSKDVLLVQRFDREKTDRGYLRARMISGLTILRADESPLARDRWSYTLLAEELRRFVAEPRKDAEELFRRMCFNALISNTDDHPRNHAAIALNQKWSLSPAYDLTPSPVVSKERRDLSMICGSNGRYANANNLRSQAARFLLSSDQANHIIETMTAQVGSTWYRVARQAGVSERDTETIKSAFCYDGFSL